MNSTRKSTKKVPFSDGLFRQPMSPGEKPYLIGSKCGLCANTFFPKKGICPECLKEGTMEEVRLSRIGKLYSFTVVRVAPSGFEAPYALGYVDLPEKVRVLAPITGWQPSENTLKIGMSVELVIGKIREAGDIDIIGYEFGVRQS